MPGQGPCGLQLDHCELTEAGITGDREFFLVDENDRLVNSKGLGALQQIVPRHDREAGLLTLAFPTARRSPTKSASTARWARGSGVQPLRSASSTGRGEAISEFAGRDLRLVWASGPAPDRLRSGAATLLGTGSLHALARILGVDEVDERRFRMNFGIDGLGEHEEDSGSAGGSGSARRSSCRMGTSAAAR